MLMVGIGSIPNRLANEQDQEKDPPITLDEVIDAVWKLNKGKSLGADNIPAELVTNAEDISCELLWKICTEVERRKMAQNLNRIKNNRYGNRLV